MGSVRFPNLFEKVKHWNLPLLIQGWIFFLVLLLFQLIWENFEAEITSFLPFVFLSDAIGNLQLTIIPALVNPLTDAGIIRDGISLILPNGLYINYFFYLSGIKQMCLVIILLLIAPGPWKHKAWFIPLALLIIQATVFGRFFLLNLYCLIQPEQLHLVKDFLFIPLFYLEILILWMAWVLLVAKTATLHFPSRGNRKN
ncbi:MAG: hypothetical protein JXA23_02560 [Bacteroidales bacterium]|nr:hypothetical protein [Bacteroidales bacterium]